MRGKIPDKFGEAFLERTPLALGIPDEMRDPKRSELLADVPGGQAIHRPATLVFPDSPADLKSLSIGEPDSLGESDRGGCNK
jgi:hypothetical protein